MLRNVCKAESTKKYNFGNENYPSQEDLKTNECQHWLVAIVFLNFKFSIYSLNLNQSIIDWLNQWFTFSLSHQWKIFFTVKSVNFHWFISLKKYFSLSNQSIFTEIISEIWLIWQLPLFSYLNQSNFTDN